MNRRADSRRHHREKLQALLIGTLEERNYAGGDVLGGEAVEALARNDCMCILVVYFKCVTIPLSLIYV